MLCLQQLRLVVALQNVFYEVAQPIDVDAPSPSYTAYIADNLREIFADFVQLDPLKAAFDHLGHLVHHSHHHHVVDVVPSFSHVPFPPFVWPILWPFASSDDNQDASRHNRADANVE